MNNGQLRAELTERDDELEVELCGSGDIVNIEISDDGRLVLFGEIEDD